MSDPRSITSETLPARRHLPFLPHIEGLRAVAIVLVVAAHYGVPGFSAGFIGVDVFFVISGFLITRLLSHELKETGTIAVGQFLVNRLRRLLPALLATVAISLLVAQSIFQTSSNLKNGETAVSALVWASNIHFAFSNFDYFDVDTQRGLFLHTWSLGVEEQFYLLYPWLLLMATRISWKKSPQQNTVPLAWLIAAGVMSFFACMVAARSEPSLAFYLTPFRAWQFLLGALVCLAPEKLHRMAGSPHFQAFAGTAMLISAMFLLTPSTSYPSVLAILPTAAAALLIASTTNGGNPESVVNSILISSPMQWLGKLSYSLYLWHWPALKMMEDLNPNNNRLLTSGTALIVSTVAAYATQQLIENPVRYGALRQVSTRLQFLLFSGLIALSVTQVNSWRDSLSTSQVVRQVSPYESAVADTPVLYSESCDEYDRSAQIKPCVFGNKRASRTVVLIGDSIGVQWFPAIEAIYSPKDWKIVVLTKSACPMLTTPMVLERTGAPYRNCDIWKAGVIDTIRQMQPDAVFMGSAASYHLSDEVWSGGTREFLSAITHYSGAIYLIEPNPPLSFDGPTCLRRQQSLGERESRCSSPAANAKYEKIIQALASEARRLPNVRMIETATFVCPDGICSAQRNGTIIYRDTAHLTATFAATASTHFQKQIGEIQPTSDD